MILFLIGIFSHFKYKALLKRRWEMNFQILFFYISSHWTCFATTQHKHQAGWLEVEVEKQHILWTLFLKLTLFSCSEINKNFKQIYTTNPDFLGDPIRLERPIQNFHNICCRSLFGFLKLSWQESNALFFTKLYTFQKLK